MVAQKSLKGARESGRNTEAKELEEDHAQSEVLFDAATATGEELKRRSGDRARV